MSVVQDLCEYDGLLHAAWKGQSGDDRLFESVFDGTNWTEQTLVGGNTSAGPSLAKLGDELVMAWKGRGSDQRLFDLHERHGAASAQELIPGFQSTTGPALADYNGRLWAAWKGAQEDQAIWYASSGDGKSWSPQNVIPGVATSVGPSLCNWQGRLYAAWKGMDNDQGIYFSSFDGSTWRPQAQIPGVASSVGPSLAAYQEKVYAVWKGVIGDEALWYSHFDGTSWAPQQVIPGVGSSAGAAVAGFGNRLYAMWKGMGTDQGLYFSSFDGQRWAAQQRVPGNTGPDAPINIGMGLQYQETTEWCWLAVAASVAHFYDSTSDVTQTGLMTKIGHDINKWPLTVNCYPDAAVLAAHPGLDVTIADPYSTKAEYALNNVGIPAQCIKSGGVGDALDVSGNNASWHPTATLAQIANEVHSGRPVCVDIIFNDGGGHVVAIAGVLNDQILILDPASGETVMDYNDFPEQYSGGATLGGYTFTKAGK